MNMTVNQGLRAMAGIFVILSVVLATWVSPYWHLFTVFIGLNLLQSAFSGWCPAMWMLEKAGFRQEGSAGDKSCCN